jgi:hypothetical protein
MNEACLNAVVAGYYGYYGVSENARDLLTTIVGMW